MAGTVAVIAVVLVAALLLGRYLRAHQERERQATKAQRANKSAQQEMMDRALASRPPRPDGEE